MVLYARDPGHDLRGTILWPAQPDLNNSHRASPICAICHWFQGRKMTGKPSKSEGLSMSKQIAFSSPERFRRDVMLHYLWVQSVGMSLPSVGSILTLR